MKIFGFAGWSGSGKTTLIERLIPLFVARGLKVSLIKHAHHTFDVDQPGKDSYRHRHAGCTEVLVSSSRRWALMHELRGAPEPGFARARRAHLAVRPAAGRGLQAREAAQARGLPRVGRRAAAASAGPGHRRDRKRHRSKPSCPSST